MVNNTVAEIAEKTHNSLSEELTHTVQILHGFDIYIGGLKISVTETVITSWIVMAVLILAAYVFTRKLETFPGKIQNIVEIIVETFNSFSKEILGHHWRHFAAYFGTIMLFLSFVNTIGIFGILRPPTKDVSLPVALSIMTILLVIGSQLRFKKIRGTVQYLFQPMPIMFPFKVLEYFIKPLSLCFRLFGNILGAFIMMELIVIVSHRFVLPAIFSLYFDIFDGLLQAFIFTFLSMIYVAEVIE